METAIGAAGWLLGKVLTKLSEDLVAAYVSSNELGLNFHDIKLKLLYTQGLLHASEGRDMSNNPGLYGLLGELSKKADEAEDMLDEIHYFMIQDQLDGTKEAAPELGDGVRGSALHVRHAARHTIGNWIPCFSCSRTQGGDSSVDVVTSDNDGGPVHKLSFDRVDMSNKIRSVIEELNSMCGPVSDLLKIPNHSNTATSTPITLKKPPTGSVSAQDKLYGREVIFEQTINELTGTKYLGETLSVMSFVGPGGMGKTTFTQHLYNEKRVEEHFIVRVWVCVSTGFDVTNLTRQTLRCIPAVEKEEYKCTVETASLDQLQKSIIERLKSKRFNHLKFLDLNLWRGSENLPKDFSRLINLRHFFSSKELHSNIPEVGKMKCLHELKEFNVKKEGVGFELKELGDLRELGGELCICNLEIVASKGEASAAKLKNKRNLKKLRLVWGAEHKTVDDDVLEGLEPHPDLRVLSITNAGVATCPRWLCDDLSTKRLESLHLEGISWVTHPAFEQLPHLTKLTLKSISGMRVLRLGFSTVTGRSFTHLKTLDLTDMPELVEWVGEPNSNLFSRLESISLEDCPSLCSFPFLEYSHLFTNLFSLDIRYCPKLSQFPPMPRTSTLSNMQLFNRSSSVVLHGKKKFRIKQYKGALAFHNLDEVEDMRIVGGPHISCSSLKKLNSLRSVHFEECDDMFFAEQDDAVVLHSVQNLVISDSRITGESFSNALKLLPALSQVILDKCKRLEFLPVEDGGLSGLRMLQSFRGLGCGNLFSRWHKGEVGGGGHAIKPFPTSLRELDISFELSIESMGLLSNLTSLTSLSLKVCKELTMDGFNPQITVNLKQLVLYANKFIAGDLLSEIARSKLMHAGSFQLEELEVDSISAVLTVPICSHLAATLHTLRFTIDKLATTFTEEQEQALLLLTSLKNLEFEWCKNLESFPRVLRGLSTLKRLRIYMCDKILCLPSKESLPASLETLVVWCDSPELTEQAKKLKGSEPWFSGYRSKWYGAGGAEQWRTVGDGRGSHNRNELVMIYPPPRPGKQQAKGGRRQQAKAKYSRRLSCLQQLVCLPSLPPLLFVRMQGREQAKVPDYIQEAERTIYADRNNGSCDGRFNHSVVSMI
ncbi:uncharacterized protein [Triticum aestivum]|uniref:uncharacterized protein n=1 Tax=Triticum aestivum TaxID=4565 RepID=UPI001D028A46|nr:uncharacterized protein LOC123139792 [Triticum aestivum]